MNTLFPKVLPLMTEAGVTIEMTVHQIKVVDYPRALLAADDEAALAAIACGVNVATVKTLSPESYETLIATVAEVNAKGFFCFARRQVERNAALMANLPPDLVQQMARQALTKSSPGSPPKLA